jgi:hypothetical protein
MFSRAGSHTAAGYLPGRRPGHPGCTDHAGQAGREDHPEGGRAAQSGPAPVPVVRDLVLVGLHLGHGSPPERVRCSPRKVPGRVREHAPARAAPAAFTARAVPGPPGVRHLAQLIRDRHVAGATPNPTIFAIAVAPCCASPGGPGRGTRPVEVRRPPNLMVKIPVNAERLPAVARALALSLVDGAHDRVQRMAGQGPPPRAVVLILPGAAHRACRPSSGVAVRPGANDALHQRAHW